MERNNNDDYTRDTSDYEPNFVLKGNSEAGTKAEMETKPETEVKPATEKTAVTETKPEAEKTAVTEPKPEVAAKPAVEAKPEATATPDLSTGAGGPQAKPTEVHPYSSSQIKEMSGADPGVAASKPAGTTARPSVAAGGTTTTTPRPSTTAGGATAATPRPSVVMGEPTKTAGRPKFENPSFDDGSGKGRFADPRRNFNYGESVSWQNGERRKSAKKKAKSVAISKKALALLVAGCLLLSTLFGFGGVMLGHSIASKDQSPTTSQSSSASTAGKTETAGYTLESATESSMTVKEITAAAKDSVVEIRTEGVTSDSWMPEYIVEGAGSGVIISENGYIMTNNHVIEGAKKIKVTTADEQEYEATLVGTDENNDVAVIKVEASGLNAATYGNSDELEVGDLAVAIGNPLGELGGTVTAGIISATDRELSIDGKTLHLLQTDSSINPGNSGGGLFNDDGQLIGLVVAKSSGSGVEGLGFAIPINTAANVAQQLMDKGYVSGQPSTGMTYQEGSSGGGFGSFDSMFGGSTAKQVYIYSVNGDNAKKAGFESGDIVLAIDDKEIASFDDLSTIITSHKVGDTVTFTISRDGNEKKIKLELEERKVTPNNGSKQNGQEGQQNDQNGGGEQPQAPDDQQGSAPEEGGGGESFSPIPEDEGGSLFDFFFGQ